MASEYELRLKATLDSSLVQQELNRLREQQLTLLGGANQAGYARKNPAAGMGNLTQLNSTMQRLLVSILNLDRAVGQLAQYSKISTNAIRQTTSPSVALTGNGMTGHFTPYQFKKALSALKSYDKLNLVWQNTLSPREQLLLQLRFGLGPNGNLAHALLFGNLKGGLRLSESIFRKKPTLEELNGLDEARNVLKTVFGSNVPPGIVNEALKDKNFIKTLDPNYASKTYNSHMVKMMSGMMLHQLTPTIQEAIGTTEWGKTNAGQTTNAVIGGLGKMTSYAVMGYSAGPYGALAGAAIGAIESVFDAITANAREAEAEIERQLLIEQTLRKRTTEYKQDRGEYFENKNFSDILDTEDNERIKGLRYSLNDRREFVKSRLATYDNLSESGMLGEADLNSANKLQKELQELDSKIKTLDSHIESFKKKQEAEQKTLNNYNKSIDDALVSVGRYDINKANLKSLSDNTYSSNLESYKSWIGNARSSRNSYIAALEKAKAETDPEKKKELMDQANRDRATWMFNLQQSDMFKGGLISNLQSILGSMKAPDMSQVNSLASQGVMISANDDKTRLNEQLNYLKEQTKLQTEMKNIINDNLAVSYQ